MTNTTKPLTGLMITALKLATSRPKGLISCGDGYPTPSATLKALHKRGLVVFVGARPRMYHGTFPQTQYRITDAGRAALAAADMPSSAPISSAKEGE